MGRSTRNVVVAVILFSPGCSDDTSIPRTDVPKNKEASAKQEKSVDHEVITTVLAELMQSHDSVIARPDGPHQGIVLRANDPESKHIPTVQTILVRFKEDRWKKLPEEQIKEIEAAAENIVQRIQNKETIENYLPEDQRVRIDRRSDPSEFTHTHLHSAVKMFPPGFSADGNLSVVFLETPWGGWHLAIETYILTKSEGKWHVVFHESAIYL